MTASRVVAPLPRSSRDRASARGRRVVQRLLCGLLLLLAGCSDLVSDGYPYNRIEVQTVRRSGEPVAGVELILYSWERHLAYGTTGADGRYVFEFVPAGQFGVRAVPKGDYVPVEFDFPTVAHDGVAVSDGGRESVSFTLLKVGPGSVEVVVRRPTGEAVEGVPVELYTFRGMAATGRTDAQGRYTFASVPFGDYGVRAFAPRGYQFAAGQDHVDGVLVDEGSRELVALALGRCVGSIEARVADPSGAPLSGVRLSLYDFRGEISQGTSGPDGRYVFTEVPCGNLGVAVVVLPGYSVEPGRGGSYVDDIQIENGTERSVSFTVTPCTGRMRVRVTDRAGAPVAGAGVVVYSFRGDIAREQTGADGTLEFRSVPCGDLGVRVDPPAGFSAEQGRGGSYFDGLLIRNGGEREVSFVLTRG